MKIRPTHVAFTTLLAALGVGAMAAQDRSTLRVPDGLSFADFKGYESWEYVSTSQTEDLVKIMAANPVMIRAYREGGHEKGKPFPDGSKIVKIEWARKPNPDIPGFGWVAGDLRFVQFMEKDSKRFAKTGGWGYAKFENDAATGALKPLGTGTDCGHACHQIAAGKDRVFTTYPAR